MVNILKSGKDKVFIEKCPICVTEFNYQLEDVTYRKYPVDDTLCSPKVTCPICGSPVTALLRTSEDIESTNVLPVQYIPCGFNAKTDLLYDEVKIV